MGSLTLDPIVHLLSGEMLTARREPMRPLHSAWVGLVHLGPRRPAYLNSADAAELGPIQIFRVEVLSELIEREDIDENECVEYRSFTVSSAHEAEQALMELGVDPANLTFKSSSGYPL